MPDVCSELEKLALLEATGGRISHAGAKNLLWFVAGASPVPSRGISKEAAVRTVGAAVSGNPDAMDAVSSAVPPWMSKLLGSLATRRVQKKAQLGSPSDYMPLQTEIDAAGSESIIGTILKMKQKKAFMQKAVQKNLRGMKVSPPAWWTGSKQEWQARLDQATAPHLIQDLIQ